MALNVILFNGFFFILLSSVKINRNFYLKRIGYAIKKLESGILELHYINSKKKLFEIQHLDSCKYITNIQTNHNYEQLYFRAYHSSTKKIFYYQYLDNMPCFI